MTVVGKRRSARHWKKSVGSRNPLTATARHPVMGSRRAFMSLRSGTRYGSSPMALIPFKNALLPTSCRCFMRRANSNCQTAWFSRVYSAGRWVTRNVSSLSLVVSREDGPRAVSTVEAGASWLAPALGPPFASRRVGRPSWVGVTGWAAGIGTGSVLMISSPKRKRPVILITGRFGIFCCLAN